ncbi:dynamin family protein [Thiocapsa roseopersicina]|uniref:Dynamin family protein n=1 Tax=Thiocapsa roseopersicina TaxID=1058 RepID=A0A1H2ZWZ8_THIRO|nr:dynamin family protein [Thiocapsa roseopersicina]SDX21404.1 Dynamin family protein [Thiocapsa roseopersicina]
MNEYQKLSDTINNIAEEASRASIKNYLKRFKETGHFDKFEERFADFKQDVQRAAEECDRAINSPVYVGVVGHYSHGKSSLLNALLSPPKSRELLPTGDSVVTAMCTLVGFKDDRQGHEFHEVKYDGVESPIPAEEYQSKVSGKRPSSLQGVHHFRIKLNTSELNPGVFQSMADKNIELLDTPGLGGPYWKDEQALQSWIKEFMLLIVAVKADAINKRVADSVNPFLKYSTRPIIPVVTFWDLWQQSDAYKGISTEEDARQKAREDLIKYFPAMSDAVEDGRVTFVSAKNYRDQTNPYETNAREFYTEDWNIDNVRTTLTNYISSKVIVLQSMRSEQSDLELNRKRRVIEGCSNLCSTYNSLNYTLKSELEATRPKAAYEEELEEAFQRIQDELTREYDRIIDKAAETVEDRVAAISTTGNLSLQLSEITKDVNIETHRLIKETLPDRLDRTLERSVKRSITRFLDNDYPIEKSKIKRMKQQVNDACRDLTEDLCKPTSQSPFNPPQGVTDLAKNVSSALFDGLKTLFTTNLPLALLILAAIFILPAITGWLSGIWLVGDKLATGVQYLQYFIFAAGVFTLFAISWSNVKRAREMTAMQVKEKARKQNRRADISDRVKPDVDAKLKTFENDIREILENEIKPLIQSGDDISEDLDRLFSDIGSQIRIIEKECSSMARGIR